MDPIAVGSRMTGHDNEKKSTFKPTFSYQALMQPELIGSKFV